MHIGFYSIHCLMAIRVRVKLSSIMGKVTIIKALDATGYYRKFGELITREDLEKFGNKIQRNYVVMLYTGFSRAWGTEEFTPPHTSTTLGSFSIVVFGACCCVGCLLWLLFISIAWMVGVVHFRAG